MDVAMLKNIIKSIKYQLNWNLEYEPKYVVENGVKRGPFFYSKKWTRVEEQSALIFGENGEEQWRKTLKDKAFNKSYTPPENHIHLARAVIGFLYTENKELKEQLIASKKEISQLKRNKN
jgi:hypothetical protein